MHFYDVVQCKQATAWIPLSIVTSTGLGIKLCAYWYIGTIIPSLATS